jgi:hypothetical protein
VIAAAPRYLAECYGGDIDALADVAGDFDAQSPEESTAWVWREWIAISATLGFAHELAEAAEALRGTRLGLVGIHDAALAVFDRWSRTSRRPLSARLSTATRSARAKVRHDVLLALGTTQRGKLWAIDERAHTLPAKACFDRGSDNAVSGRAFLGDAAENFFHGNRHGGLGQQPTSACGWSTPVILSLGTYPWVFGSKLHRTPPGLDWDAVPPWNPAATAMRLSTSLWQPLGNLEQDATQVVQRFRHYKRATDAALADIPVRSAASSAPVTRDGLLLHAAHGSLDIVGVNSALGYLSAAAHNFVIHRFAAFFAVRRAHARAASRLSVELRRAIARNPDPCLRHLADEPRARGFATAGV